RRLFSGGSNRGPAITSATDRLAMAQLVFMPGRQMSLSTPDASNYAVQVMDARGCYQYMTICGIDAAAARTEEAVILNLAGAPVKGLLSPGDTGGDICGARVMEEVAVAPIHRVRWYIGPETADGDPDGVRAADPNAPVASKFNLYRQLLPADGDP